MARYQPRKVFNEEEHEKEMKKKEDKTLVIEKIKNADGSSKEKEWRRGELIAKGSQATCFFFTDIETKMRYVCKRIDKCNISRVEEKKKVMQEIKIHRQLKHLHVVKFMHFFDDEKYIHIMLEICHNKSLEDLLHARKKLHEVEV